MEGILSIALILGGFEGYYVVERSQFHGCHNSHKQWLHISRVALSRTFAGVWFVSLWCLASGLERVGKTQL